MEVLEFKEVREFKEVIEVKEVKAISFVAVRRQGIWL